jgi:hypothetical protein
MSDPIQDRRSQSLTRSVWRECFAQVQGLLYRDGYTKWLALKGFPVIKKKMLDPIQEAEVWSKVILLGVVYSCWFPISLGSFESDVLCVETTLGKILTLDNLGKGKVLVVYWCCMCKRNEESIDLLLHCKVARELWALNFHFVSVEWSCLKG